MILELSGVSSVNKHVKTIICKANTSPIRYCRIPERNSATIEFPIIKA